MDQGGQRLGKVFDVCTADPSKRLAFFEPFAVRVQGLSESFLISGGHRCVAWFEHDGSERAAGDLVVVGEVFNDV